MEFSIQIRFNEQFFIPADAGYRPLIPHYPELISLGARDMLYVTRFMVAAGAVDEQITSEKKRRQCAKGRVPIYKFSTNDGYVVTAKEAALIADAMVRHDLFSPEFFITHFPRFDPIKYKHLGGARALIALWIAFNRVAAANDGYTIK